MLKRCSPVWCLMLLVAVCLPAQHARGGVWNEVLVGLDYAGFAFAGDYNPLSDGHTLTTVRNFQATPIDLGFVDLTLNGPVGATVTTSNRFVRGVDFAFSAGTPDAPLSYVYTADIGANEVQIGGSQVLGLNGSINEWGWYDLRFQFSSRQEILSTGRFANSDGEFIDYDIGPINISGNLFADLLATITDPFYEAAGYENIFALFSGRTMREDALASTVSGLQAKVASGASLTEKEVSDLVQMAIESRIHGDDVPDLSFLQESMNLEQPSRMVLSSSHTPPVPEPATLLLLLAPLAALRRRG